MTAVGWLMAIVLQLDTEWLKRVPVRALIIIFFALLLPVVVTSFFKIPRVWKHIARVLLGFLVASAIWFFFITDQWWVRGVIAVVYFAVKIPLDRRRRRQNEQVLHAHASAGHNSGRRSRGRGRTGHAH